MKHKYSCIECGKPCSNKKDLQCHVDNKHKSVTELSELNQIEKSYMGNDCEESFPTINEMNRHQDNKHKIICLNCDQEFSNNEDM